eukprot:scaffold2346_cov71-Phaeocystis_antarctica.AAC.6
MLPALWLARSPSATGRTNARRTPISQAANASGRKVAAMVSAPVPNRRIFHSGAIRIRFDRMEERLPDVGKPKRRYIPSASASKAASQSAAPRPRAHMATSHGSRGLRSWGATARDMCAPAGMCAPVSTRASTTTRCRAMTPPGLSCAAETVTSS